MLRTSVPLTDSTMGEVDSRAFKISPVTVLEHPDAGCSASS